MPCRVVDPYASWRLLSESNSVDALCGVSRDKETTKILKITRGRWWN